MRSEEEIEKWKTQMIRLNQALLGAISSNFRQVILDRDEGADRWSIRFILETENKEDREEIDDVITDLDAMQEAPIDWSVDVTINSGKLKPINHWLSAEIYRRRESS